MDEAQSRTARPFASLLSRYVNDYVKRTGLTKRVIADRCEYNQSTFSRFLSGKREPRARDQILRIARAIDLTPRETNHLLIAAGLSPVSELEEGLSDRAQHEVAAAIEGAAAALRMPDRAALAEVMRGDIAMLLGAWQEYLDQRMALYARDWQHVITRTSAGQHHYEALRAIAARFLAYTQLLEAAAHHHAGDVEAAERSARSALRAALKADDAMLQCRCHARIGDINKIGSRFRDAKIAYAEAEECLFRVPAEHADWTAIWQARLSRKRGTLALFQGQPLPACELIQNSIDKLEEIGRATTSPSYEFARAYLALGWAKKQMGDVDGAIEAHEMCLIYTRERSVHSALDRGQGHGGTPDGHPDHPGYIEAHLSLAADHLQIKQYDEVRLYLAHARGHLEQLTGVDPDAVEPRGQGRPSYHELGRYYLLLGRYHRHADAGSEGMEMARRYLRWGRDFHLRIANKDAPRLASLYIAAARLELSEHNADVALRFTWDAERWANASDPPNLYYRAEALLLRYRASIEVEEDGRARDKAAADARAACLCLIADARAHWHLLAQLDASVARERARLGDRTGFVEHAADALLAGVRHNSAVAMSMGERLRAIIEDDLPVALAAAARHALAARVGKQRWELTTGQRAAIEQVIMLLSDTAVR